MIFWIVFYELYFLLLRSHAPLSGGSNARVEGTEQNLPHQGEKGRGFFCPFPQVSITFFNRQVLLLLPENLRAHLQLSV